MKPEDVRSIAKSRGVHPGKLQKTESIRTLQTGEGVRSFFAVRSFDVAKKGEQS